MYEFKVVINMDFEKIWINMYSYSQSFKSCFHCTLSS